MLRFADRRRIVLIFAAFAAVVAGVRRETEAHTPITSRYTFNEDIYPILRDHCGGCHVEGGPAPMGLLTWNNGPNSAMPWAESIRELIIGEQMPPWYVDSAGPAIRGNRGLNAAQADKLLIWATGGTPQGPIEKAPPAPAALRPIWRSGLPDLRLPMPADYTVPADVSNEIKEFVIPTALNESRWVKAADLLPGAPSIVRNAVISIDNGPVLAVWVPGDDPIAAPDGTAFRVPAGARLRLQIHYKKQWQSEGQAVRDRSTVGLYFTEAPASGKEIQSLTTDGPKFGGVIAGGGRVVAIRPSLDQPYGSFTVQARTPSGATVPLLKLRNPRPEWRRRYWRATPVDLPAGSRIEAVRTAIPDYIDLTGSHLMRTYPLQVGVDFVAR